MTDALEGAEVCVVGHSNTVGKPLALLLLNRNATTTVTHVYTSNRGNLAKHTQVADYLVVAAGVPHLVGADLVKEGAVVLDVGINRVVVCPKCGALNRSKKNPCKACGADLAEAQNKTVGDVDFDAVSAKAARHHAGAGRRGRGHQHDAGPQHPAGGASAAGQEVAIPRGNGGTQVDHLEEETLRGDPRGSRRRDEGGHPRLRGMRHGHPDRRRDRRWPR